jgi:hypothetical protein
VPMDSVTSSNVIAAVTAGLETSGDETTVLQDNVEVDGSTPTS